MRLGWLSVFLVLTAPATTQESRRTPIDANLVGPKGTIKLADYRGKQPVVLLFMRGFTGEFACYHCGVQTRAYRAQYEDLRAAGAEVLMVLPFAKDIAGYLKQIGESGEPPEPGFTTPFPVVLDPDGSACKAFQVTTDAKAPDFPVFEPATIVIGKDGTVLLAHHGKDPSDRPEVATVLAALRGTAPEQPTSQPATPPAPIATRAWLEYEAGMQLAKAQRQPMLLEFHAVW